MANQPGHRSSSPVATGEFGNGHEVQLPSDTTSLWVASAPGRAFPTLASDLDVDVAIVGGGITGLTAATLLKEAGRKVAVLDAHRIARGESGRTTAHLSAYTDARVKTLIRHFGAESARRVWAAGTTAIAQIEDWIGSRGIACGFERLPAYLYTERAEGLAELQAEYAALCEIEAPVTLLQGGVPLPFPAHAALRFEDQAQFHPRRYLLALAEALPGDGSHVFEDTRAISIEGEATPRITTEQGVVRAADVIVAANVPINNRVLLQTKIAHYRSYAIALEIDGPAPVGLFWDDEDPYHYVRSHAEAGSQLLIVGGEDHRTGQESDTPLRYERLLAWARERFAVRSVVQRWSGQIIEPVDGLPYIGHNSFSRHVWEATGYSGNGMTFGTLAGMLLSELILERGSPWRELFDATRITPLASAKDYLQENLEFPKRFIVDRLKHEPSELSALARDDGGLFTIENRKVALYRDVSGELHALSPVCPHLKCLVEFNRAERTWDCPCHGSRFDVHGETLNGPAARGLERIRLVPPI